MNGTIRQSPAMGTRYERIRPAANGNGHSAPLPLQCPPYRAYILPARSCRPGKRSAARQWAQEMNGTVRQSPAMGILRHSRFNARW
ncbi:hypothetical protein ACJEQM_21470, partial [Klebsiella pneumoniae]